jgi:Zn-dependent peptidase ImmA (M78 family)
MNYERIIELAESLAEEHCMKRGGDPHIAFRDYEVMVVEDDFGNDFEGLIRFKDNEYQVFVNSGHNAARTIGRRRFTAAHELGHFSISEHRDAIRTGSGVHKSKTGFATNEPMEREADIFASHFMIPSKILLKHHSNEKWGADVILNIANLFETSITCAALRCQYTLPGNSTLILWNSDNVRWQRMNKDWWFQLPSRTIRNSDQLAKGSATEVLLNGGNIPECGYLRRGTTRSAWFPRVAPWTSINDVLIEDAIPLGSYGVLTLLRPDSAV